MPDSFLVLPAAIAVGIFGLALIGALPRPLLLIALILLRTIADIGNTSGSGPLLPNTAMSAVIGLVAISAALLPFDAKLSSRARSVIMMSIVAVSFWTLISIFYFSFSSEFLNEFVRTLSFISMLALAYRIGVDSCWRLPTWLNWLVAVPAIILIFGYVAGYAPMLNTTGRATGTFSQANQAAAYFAVGVVACIWGYWASGNKSALFVALLGVVALLLTQSIGAFLAMGCGAIVLFSMNSQLSLLKRVILIAFGLSLLISLFLALGVSNRIAEFQTVDYGDAESDNSLDWRFANWRALVDIWWDRAPFFGLGFGSTGAEIRPLGQLPHSVYVQLLVETGIIGLVVVLAFIWILVLAIRKRSAGSSATAAVLAAVCVVVATHGFAANWLNYSAAQYLTVFVLGVLLGGTVDRLGIPKGQQRAVGAIKGRHEKRPKAAPAFRSAG